MSNTSEHDKQRRLTYIGIGTLLAAPFIGPLALVAGGAIFAGKILRPMFNEEAKKDYLAKKREVNPKEKSKTPEIYLTPNYSPVPVCIPSRDFSLTGNDNQPKCSSAIYPSILEGEDERKEYTKGLVEGAIIANKYVNKMSPEERDSIYEIIINPKRRRNPLEAIIKNDK